LALGKKVGVTLRLKADWLKEEMTAWEQVSIDSDCKN